MRKFIFYTLFIGNFSVLNGQIGYFKSEADSCGPSFKEIYDFQVGDVYQYVEKSSSSAGGAYPTTRITSKFTITDKIINGDTLLYSIDGIRKVDNWCDGIGFGPGCDFTSKSNLFSDRLMFIDSVNHCLNKCEGDLVSHLNFTEDDLNLINPDIE